MQYYIWLWSQSSNTTDITDYLKALFNPEYFKQTNHSPTIAEFVFSTKTPLMFVDKALQIGAMPSFTRLLWSNPMNESHTTLKKLAQYQLTYPQYIIREYK
jgi:hypothetical protein